MHNSKLKLLQVPKSRPYLNEIQGI